MKQLTDSEKLSIAVPLLDGRGLMEYANRCRELEQDCERNSFHNVPAECEDKECMDCDIAHAEQVILGCPHMDLECGYL